MSGASPPAPAARGYALPRAGIAAYIPWFVHVLIAFFALPAGLVLNVFTFDALRQSSPDLILLWLALGICVAVPLHLGLIWYYLAYVARRKRARRILATWPDLTGECLPLGAPMSMQHGIDLEAGRFSSLLVVTPRGFGITHHSGLMRHRGRLRIDGTPLEPFIPFASIANIYVDYVDKAVLDGERQMDRLARKLASVIFSAVNLQHMWISAQLTGALLTINLKSGEDFTFALPEFPDRAVTAAAIENAALHDPQVKITPGMQGALSIETYAEWLADRIQAITARGPVR